MSREDVCWGFGLRFSSPFVRSAKIFRASSVTSIQKRKYKMDLALESQHLGKLAAVGATAVAVVGGAAFLAAQANRGPRAPASYSIPSPIGTTKAGEGMLKRPPVCII